MEFRNKQDPPSKPGWYYARYNELPSMPLEPIEVVELHQPGTQPRVVVDGSLTSGTMQDYDWFGPVHEVREG